jgi:hypothetical protein
MDIKSEYETNGWVQLTDSVPLPFIEECRQELGRVINEVAQARA